MPTERPLLKNLSIEQLQRGRYQPRRQFDEGALTELANSIQSQGLIQPVVVRPLSAERYEIIAGERRWRAAQMAQLEDIPCLIRPFSNEQAAAVATIENVQREDLNPIEEAEAYHRLICEFDYFHDEVAAVVGVSRAKVSNALRLLKLELPVKKYLEEKKLRVGHGKVLAGVQRTLQKALADQAIAKNWSVRKLEQEAKKAQESATSAIRSPDCPNVRYLEQNLSEIIGSQVKVENDHNQKSGWLKIKYFDNETLAGLLEKMGVKVD